MRVEVECCVCQRLGYGGGARWGGRATFLLVSSGILFSLALLYWHYSIAYHIMIPVLQLWIARKDSPLILFSGARVLYIRASGSRKTPNPDTWIRTSFFYTVVGIPY